MPARSSPGPGRAWRGRFSAGLAARTPRSSSGPGLPQIWRCWLAFLAACTAERHRASAVCNLALAFASLEGPASIRAETLIA